MKLIGTFNLMQFIFQRKPTKNIEGQRQLQLEKKKRTLEEFKILNVYEKKGTLRGNCKIKNYVDGSRYEGQILGDKRSGKGIYYYANGDIYLGDWQDDKFHGSGTYLFANREKFVGQLKEGKKCGKGTYYYMNGNTYVGDWMDDKRHGNEKYIYYSTDESYEGEWKEGIKHMVEGQHCMLMAKPTMGTFDRMKDKGMNRWSFMMELKWKICVRRINYLVGLK